MSAATFEEIAQKRVLREEHDRSRSRQDDLARIREGLAREISIAPGSLENVRRGRLKEFRRTMAEKLGAFMIRQIQTELQHHHHDLAIILSSGVRPDASEVLAIRAQITRLAALLEDAAR